MTVLTVCRRGPVPVGTVIALRPLGAVRAITALLPVAARLRIGAVAPWSAVTARRLARLLVSVIVANIIVGSDHFAAVIFVIVLTRAALILLLEARPTVLEHAEIMIRKLKVIFGLDAVTGKLRVARQGLVFFQ